MIDHSVLSLVSAATALAASVMGPLVSLHVARTQIRATVRSANRQRWIDEFRDLVATFCGQMAAATQIRGSVIRDGQVSIAAESELLLHFERLIATATKIRLMIDPLDGRHDEIIRAVDDLLSLFRTAADDNIQEEARAGAMRLVKLSLGIIRHEWLRVQRGA